MDYKFFFCVLQKMTFRDIFDRLVKIIYKLYHHIQINEGNEIKRHKGLIMLHDIQIS